MFKDYNFVLISQQVKKKWSLRSISFSRKDKPKQEKKQKDDESKTNGEPEKVPEEVSTILKVNCNSIQKMKRIVKGLFISMNVLQ